jgi:hypothetical protein
MTAGVDPHDPIDCNRLADAIAAILQFSGSPDASDPGAGREDLMLTRRGFAGFASCAICGITQFVAAEAAAQGAPPAAGGVARKILSQTDGPTPGYVTLLVEATVEAGVAVGRHTHPGNRIRLCA